MKATAMKAMVFRELGGPEVLHLEDVPAVPDSGDFSYISLYWPPSNISRRGALKCVISLVSLSRYCCIP